MVVVFRVFNTVQARIASIIRVTPEVGPIYTTRCKNLKDDNHLNKTSRVPF
jgi:hypothetical protein